MKWRGLFKATGRILAPPGRLDPGTFFWLGTQMCRRPFVTRRVPGRRCAHPLSFRSPPTGVSQAWGRCRCALVVSHKMRVSETQISHWWLCGFQSIVSFTVAPEGCPRHGQRHDGLPACKDRLDSEVACVLQSRQAPHQRTSQPKQVLHAHGLKRLAPLGRQR